MIYFVHSSETASSNIAHALREILGLEEVEVPRLEVLWKWRVKDA